MVTSPKERASRHQQMEIDCNKPWRISVCASVCVVGATQAFYRPVIPFGRNSRTMQTHKFIQTSSDSAIKHQPSSSISSVKLSKEEKDTENGSMTNINQHLVPLGSTRFFWDIVGSNNLYLSLLGSTALYQVLLSCTGCIGYQLVPLGCTRLHWVPLGSTGSHRAVLGFIPHVVSLNTFNQIKESL